MHPGTKGDVVEKDERTYKVVAPSRKRLHHRHLVVKGRFCRFSATSFSPGKIVNEAERRRPHDDKVEYHRDEDAEDRTKILYDVVSLIGKHDEDGV